MKVSMLGLLFFAGISCSGPAAQESPVEVRLLAKGAVSGVIEAKEEVLRDQAAWTNWWNRHSAPRTKPPAPPAVDFAKEMVVAVTMGRQKTGGFGIEIVRADRFDRQLVVKVRRTSPPPNAMTMQMLTAPFHAVALPRSEHKVVFEQTATDPKRPEKQP
jgi:hypothetical protein